MPNQRQFSERICISLKKDLRPKTANNCRPYFSGFLVSNRKNKRLGVMSRGNGSAVFAKLWIRVQRSARGKLDPVVWPS